MEAALGASFVHRVAQTVRPLRHGTSLTLGEAVEDVLAPLLQTVLLGV